MSTDWSLRPGRLADDDWESSVNHGFLLRRREHDGWTGERLTAPLYGVDTR